MVTGRGGRIVNIPTVLLVMVGVLLLIQAGQELLSPVQDLLLIQALGFVPGRLTYAFDPDKVTAALDELTRASEDNGQIARFFLGDGTADWWTTLTYALLHGSWTHVGLNCLMLVAFGTPVARRFGVPRFLLFSIATILAGAAMHYLFHGDDLEPVIGASALVSGATAAAARFAFRDPAMHNHPALSLPEMVRDRRVMTFLVAWLILNLASGLAAAPFGFTDMTIAWEAHLGGFLVGLFAFPLFDPAPEAI